MLTQLLMLELQLVVQGALKVVNVAHHAGVLSDTVLRSPNHQAVCLPAVPLGMVSCYNREF